MKITEALSLSLSQREINFIDLNFKTDTALFLDPFSFKKKQNTFCKQALITIDSFFEKVKEAVINNDEDYLSELLSHTSEAKYLPLGYSLAGRGSGAGDELRKGLIKALIKEYNESFRNSLSILNDFGNIPGIKNDIISDIIGNLITENLSQYTLEQCQLHGKEKFLTTKTLDLWSSTEQKWITKKLPILTLEGKELFLIPRDILRSNVINMRNTLTTYLVKENIITKRNKALNKEEILSIMKNYSDNYTNFINDRIETDTRVKTISREKLIQKLTNNTLLEKSYKVSKNTDNLNILDFKEIIEFLFVEYVTCPRLKNKNNRIYLVYDNLKEKKDFPKTENVFFTKSIFHQSIKEYQNLLSSQNGIGIILTSQSNENLEKEVKKLCQETDRELIFITISEINTLLSGFKIGKNVNFKRVDAFIKNKRNKKNL